MYIIFKLQNYSCEKMHIFLWKNYVHICSNK